jgi:hypothetical protein
MIAHLRTDSQPNLLMKTTIEATRSPSYFLCIDVGKAEPTVCSKTVKSLKQSIIAVMRKLLHQIYGILESGQPHNPEKPRLRWISNLLQGPKAKLPKSSGLLLRFQRSILFRSENCFPNGIHEVQELILSWTSLYDHKRGDPSLRLEANRRKFWKRE